MGTHPTHTTGGRPSVDYQPKTLDESDGSVAGSVVPHVVAQSGAGGSAQAAIASGASLSAAVDLGDRARLCRIAMPAAWDAADLTVQTSYDGATWNDLYDAAGTVYTVKAAAGRADPAADLRLARRALAQGPVGHAVCAGQPDGRAHPHPRDGRELTVPAFLGARRAVLGRAAAASLDPAAAYIARMAVQPSAARRAVIGDLVAALMAGGLWIKLSVLHLLAAHDGQAARLNVKGPYADASLVGAPSFTVDRGYQGDGVSSWLDLGVPYGSLPLIGTTDHAQFVWSLTNATGSIFDAMTVNSFVALINGRNASNALTVRAASSGSLVTAAVTDSVGFYGFNWTGGANLDAVKNGVSVASAARTAGGWSADNVLLCKGTRRLGAHVITRSLSASELTALHQALLAYMQAVGAV